MGEEPEVVDVVEAAPAEAAPVEVVRYTGVEPPEAMLWKHFATVATTLASTDFVPVPYRNNRPAIMACLAYGHEIGLGPMQALQSIDVIQGKPTLKPEAMGALVLQAGHTLVRTAVTDDSVTWYGKRIDNGAEETVTFTLADAAAMGLLGKDNWKRMPRQMLSSRGRSELVRSLFPDCIRGASYTAEELGGDEAPGDVWHEEAGAMDTRVDTSRPEIGKGAGQAPHSGDTAADTPPAARAFDPGHRQNTRVDVSPTEWGWHNVEIDGDRVAVCNRCTHPLDDHASIRRGCRWCACNYVLDVESETMKTVGAASPSSQGEAEPAGPTAVAEVPVNTDDHVADREGSAPPPTYPPAPVSVPEPAVGPESPGGPPSSGAGPISPATERQRNGIFAACRANGLDEDDRHALTLEIAAGRTDSTKELTYAEASEVLRALGLVRVGSLRWHTGGEGGRRLVGLDDRGTKFLNRNAEPENVA